MILLLCYRAKVTTSLHSCQVLCENFLLHKTDSPNTGRMPWDENYVLADANLSAKIRLNAPSSVGSLPSVEGIILLDGTP
jgi:hypothetical protein